MSSEAGTGIVDNRLFPRLATWPTASAAGGCRGQATEPTTTAFERVLKMGPPARPR